MIIKLSSSGKQVQVVDDDGNVFGTSKNFLETLLKGQSKINFLLMTKMPFKVSKTRFAKSPTWNPVSGEKEIGDVSLNDDPYALSSSYKEVKKRKENKPLKKVFDW